MFVVGLWYVKVFFGAPRRGLLYLRLCFPLLLLCLALLKCLLRGPIELLETAAHKTLFSLVATSIPTQTTDI